MKYELTTGRGIQVEALGDKSRVLRVEPSKCVQILKGMNGVYILLGRGKYYVGKGDIGRRVARHLKDKGKDFSRVYALLVRDKGEYKEKFERYLYDVEGEIDNWMAESGLERMNKVQTREDIHFLKEQQTLIREYKDIVGQLEPTLIDRYQTTAVIQIKREEVTENKTKKEQSKQTTISTEHKSKLSKIEEVDREIIKNIPTKIDEAKTHIELGINQKVLDRYVETYKDVHGVDNKYYREKVLSVYVSGGELGIEDPYNDYTQKQKEEYLRILNHGYRHQGFIRGKIVGRKSYKDLKVLGIILKYGKDYLLVESVRKQL